MALNGRTIEKFGRGDPGNNPVEAARSKVKRDRNPEYNTCQCEFVTFNRQRKDWARNRFGDHELVTFGRDFKAIYKPGKEDGVAIVFLCDALGTEMNGSRTLMEDLGRTGAHVIKPMIYENDQESFMNMLVSFSRGERPTSYPPEIEETLNYLAREKGITKFGLIGACWGGYITQLVLSDAPAGNFKCAVSVDGLYRDEQYMGRIPSKYFCGYEGAERFEYIHGPMRDIIGKS